MTTSWMKIGNEHSRAVVRHPAADGGSGGRTVGGKLKNLTY
jgi:hypothetical protein